MCVFACLRVCSRDCIFERIHPVLPWLWKMMRRYRTRTDNSEWLNYFHNMKCLHTRLESGRQIAFRMNYGRLNVLEICPFLRETHYKASRLRYAQMRLAGPQPFCWVTLNACGSEAVVACCTMTSPMHLHPLSTREKAVHRSPPSYGWDWCQFPANSQCTGKAFVWRWKASHPLPTHRAASTPSRDSAQLRLPTAPSPPSHDGDNTTNNDKQAVWPGSDVSSRSYLAWSCPSEDQAQTPHTCRESEKRHWP